MSITGNATIWGNGVISIITAGSGFTGPDYLKPDDTSLALFYPFLSTDVSNGKLGDHATSTIAYDAVLNYTPTFGTTNSFATGRSYININSSSTATPIKLPSIQFNKTYTCCFWCKCLKTTISDNMIGVVVFNSGASPGGYVFSFTNYYTAATVGIPFMNGWEFNETFNPANTLNSNDGNWHHYCLVANKGTGDILYIDGVYYGTGGRGGDFSSWLTTGAPLYNMTLNKFYLGCLWWDANCYLNGSMGDFRMYSRELLPLEISNLYNNGTIKPTTAFLPPTISTYSFISNSILTYTGSNQSITIPATANHMIVSCWGAGGASKGVSVNSVKLLLNSVGGGGGFTQSVFSVSAANQSNYNVIVGGKGISAPVLTPAPGGFGGGGASTNWITVHPGDTNWCMCSGGGRSALQYNSNDIITAGGGGAGGSTYLSSAGITMNGGAGGGLIGGSGDQTGGGTGGTQSAGGTGSIANGSKYQGGNSSDIYAPGGGGYYGGGCASYANNGNNGLYIYGGGGGSSYVDSSSIATAVGFTNIIAQATKSVPPNISGLPSTIASNTIGFGGATGGFDGGNGLVVISFYT